MADIDKIRYYPVKKSNDLIQKTSFMLSSQEYDLLQYLIMKIKDEDTELKEHEISITEYCSIAGIAPSGSNYENIKASLKSLADKSVWVDFGDGSQRLVRWIEDPEIWKGDGNGVVKVKLKKIWEPFLLQLKKYYTVITLQDILPMKSVYGKRIYELLNSYLMNRKDSVYVEFTVEELRKKLLGEELWNKKYKLFADFRKNALEPAMKDMEKYGNIDATIEFKRVGRAYKYIIFTAKYKDFTKRIEAGENQEEYF